MAISQLVAGGTAAAERPKTIRTPKNERIEKTSSSMFEAVDFGTAISSLGDLSNHLARIQETAKKIVADINKTIKSLRDLGRTIVRDFRGMNSEIAASRIDVSKLAISEQVIPEGTPITVPQVSAAPAGIGTPIPNKNEDGGITAFDLLGALAVYGITKELLVKLASVAKWFSGGLGAAILGVTSVAGLIGLLAYERKKAQEQDPLGAENFDRSIASGSKRAEIIQGPEADRNAPMPNADISRRKLAPPDFLMKEGIIKLPSEAKNVIDYIKGDIIVLKDGRWWDNKEQIIKNPPAPITREGKPVGSTSSVSPTIPTTTPTEAGATSSTGTTEYSGKSQPAPAVGTPRRRIRDAITMPGPGEGDGVRAASGTFGSSDQQTNEALSYNPVTGEKLKGTGTSAHRARARGSVLGQAAREDKAGFGRISTGAGGEDLSPYNQTVYAERNIGGTNTQVPIYYNPITDKQYSPEAAINAAGRTRPEMLRGRMEQFNRQQEVNALRIAEEMRMRGSVRALEPIVMNSSSTTNIGTSSGGETNNMTGQNFPMSAVNQNILPFLAKQNINYQ